MERVQMSARKVLFQMGKRKSPPCYKQDEGINKIVNRRKAQTNKKMLEKFFGKKVLIRAYSAGVQFGVLDGASDDCTIIRLKYARRVHYWDGAASISQMAVDGVSKPNNCRFSVIVPTIIITGVVEIIPISDTAIANLESVGVWKV